MKRSKRGDGNRNGDDGGSGNDDGNWGGDCSLNSEEFLNLFQQCF
jgi:hypothetical protein